MELIIYGYSCASTRKAKKWLTNHNIPFVFRDIIKHPVKEDEIRMILSLTEGGTDDIISKRSNIYQELNLDLDTIPLKELYELIHQHPKLLRQPIIVGDHKIQIGFDKDNIRQFIPREDRTKNLHHILSLC
ncbi:MAG TPA: Spx/MgsR family RNA polymerase-binding regulatory protein [Pseudogracilibacillus sp.]|nr:Spx/MgsR family RNA polymerase-binding regulatory protein [Pseudogracilibacillus sp.]